MEHSETGLDWLDRRGFGGQPWKALLDQLPDSLRSEFNIEFNRCREDYLDRCAGACLLKIKELSQIVAKSLLHFDGTRYRMGDFIVMPNHVHLLCVFPNHEMMRDQFDSWQHFTAVKINERLGRKGKFWQGDPFDHLVRSPEHYDYLRDYIANNPLKAGLSTDEFYFRRYEG